MGRSGSIVRMRLAGYREPAGGQWLTVEVDRIRARRAGLQPFQHDDGVGMAGDRKRALSRRDGPAPHLDVARRICLDPDGRIVRPDMSQEWSDKEAHHRQPCTMAARTSQSEFVGQACLAMGGLPLRERLGPPSGQLTARSFSRDAQPEGEHRAPAGRRLGPDVATHRLEEPPTDVQSDAGAGGVARGFRRPDEQVEDGLSVGG